MKSFHLRVQSNVVGRIRSCKEYKIIQMKKIEGVIFLLMHKYIHETNITIKIAMF